MSDVPPLFLNLVYEDPLSLATMKKILTLYQGRVCLGSLRNAEGFGKIRLNIRKYNVASQYFPYFILTDLDAGACAPSLINEWLPEGRRPSLLFRVAVREVEAWLLGDDDSFSTFLGIPKIKIPKDPDLLMDPKDKIFSLVRSSRKRDLREAILPTPQSRIGPAYNSVLPRFVRDSWDPVQAARHSPSLEKTLSAVDRFLEGNRSPGHSGALTAERPL